jgi:hypothetical protein
MSKDFSHSLQYFVITDISGIGFQNATILMGIGIDFYNHTIVNEKQGVCFYLNPIRLISMHQPYRPQRRPFAHD